MSLETPGMAESRLPYSNLRFIFWRHIDENIPYVLPELEEADLILAEGAPLIEKPEKLRREALANFVLGGELTSRHANILRRNFGIEDVTYDPKITEGLLPIMPQIFDALTVGIMRSFGGSGKNLRFLDANGTDHPEAIAEVRGMIAAQTACNEALARGEIGSFDEFRAAFDGVFKLRGTSLAHRDAIIELQIESALDDNPGAKAVVLYGKNHSAISHRFLRLGAERVFVSGPDSSTETVQSYGLDAQLERRHRFGKTVPIDLYKRKALKDSLTSVLSGLQNPTEITEKVSKFDPEMLKHTDVADYVASTASTEVVERYLDLLEQYLASKDPSSGEALLDFVGSLI